jgi:hypothetical protein
MGVEAAGENATGTAPNPVPLLSFNPSDVRVRIRNARGKKIVGLIFNVAPADAAEHWKWLHYDFDDARPIQDFGWTKSIKEGGEKTLSRYPADVAIYYGGGAMGAPKSQLGLCENRCLASGHCRKVFKHPMSGWTR